VDFRRGVAPEFRKFLRPDEEIAALAGARVLDDVRFNADGSPDVIKWSRPQQDGAAMGALAALRFWQAGTSSSGAARARLGAMIRRDLDYTLGRCGAPGFDIWEEEFGHHYYTRLVQATALRDGAGWAREQGDDARQAEYGEAAAQLEAGLETFWSDAGFYRSRLAGPTVSEGKALDFAVILAVLHAGRAGGRHSVLDERVEATFARLAALFAEDYLLNRGHAAPFAFGRFRGDVYYSGGAYYFSSFGAADYLYRRAAALRGAAAADALARGDAIMAALRRHIPDSGELSEQFDRTTGAQTSARNLTWSYAALLAAAAARRAARRAARGR
jgi:glucoamylase